ncbi:hypothetical protein HOD29_05135 [archaeon]|jgi:hypothetical protein|nr:hypothetical protein [archaeon]
MKDLILYLVTKLGVIQVETYDPLDYHLAVLDGKYYFSHGYGEHVTEFVNVFDYFIN